MGGVFVCVCVCVCVRSCVGVVGLVLCWLYVNKKYSKSSGARGIALTCRLSLAELRLSRPRAAEGPVCDEGRRCGLGFGGRGFLVDYGAQVRGVTPCAEYSGAFLRKVP